MFQLPQDGRIVDKGLSMSVCIAFVPSKANIVGPFFWLFLL